MLLPFTSVVTVLSKVVSNVLPNRMEKSVNCAFCVPEKSRKVKAGGKYTGILFVLLYIFKNFLCVLSLYVYMLVYALSAEASPV